MRVQIGRDFGRSTAWAETTYQRAVAKLARDRITLGQLLGRDLSPIAGRPCYLPTLLREHDPKHGSNLAELAFVDQYLRWREQGIGVLRRLHKHHIVDLKIGLGVARWLELLPYTPPKWNGKPRALHDFWLVDFSFAEEPQGGQA